MNFEDLRKEVEGSVNEADNGVCVPLSLYRCPVTEQYWFENSDSTWSVVPKLEEEIVVGLARRIKGFYGGARHLPATESVKREESIGAWVSDQLREKYLGEGAQPITEGFFSWVVDGEPIWNKYSPNKPTLVYMYDDKGNKWEEPNYEGYGVFGGKDYYELLAEMNGLRTREEGIELAFGEDAENIKYPRFSWDGSAKYEDLEDPVRHEGQGYWAESRDLGEMDDRYADGEDLKADGSGESIPVRIMKVSPDTWAVAGPHNTLHTADNPEELDRWVEEQNAAEGVVRPLKVVRREDEAVTEGDGDEPIYDEEDYAGDIEAGVTDGPTEEQPLDLDSVKEWDNPDGSPSEYGLVPVDVEEDSAGNLVITFEDGKSLYVQVDYDKEEVLRSMTQQDGVFYISDEYMSVAEGRNSIGEAHFRVREACGKKHRVKKGKMSEGIVAEGNTFSVVSVEGKDSPSLEDINDEFNKVFREMQKTNPRGYRDEFEQRFELIADEIAQKLGGTVEAHPNDTGGVELVFNFTGMSIDSSKIAQAPGGGEATVEGKEEGEGKTCRHCGHLIYNTKTYGKRCGPGCDHAVEEAKGEGKKRTPVPSELYDESPVDGSDYYAQYDADGNPIDVCRSCGELTYRDELTGDVDSWTCPECPDKKSGVKEGGLTNPRPPRGGSSGTRPCPICGDYQCDCGEGGESINIGDRVSKDGKTGEVWAKGRKGVVSVRWDGEEYDSTDERPSDLKLEEATDPGSGGGGIDAKIRDLTQELYSDKEALRMELARGLYWYASDSHEGQSSELYSILSTLGYKPAPSEYRLDPDEDFYASVVYDALESGELDPAALRDYIDGIAVQESVKEGSESKNKPQGVGQLRASWDVGNIVDEEAKYRAENPEDFPEYEDREEKPSEDEIRDELYQDQDFWDMQWEDHKDWLTEIISEVNPGGEWDASVENFGWMGQSGTSQFRAETGEELLQNVLPNTDNTYYIYDYEEDGQKGLAINNFHHDAPTGKEWYYLLPAKEEEEEEEDDYADDDEPETPVASEPEGEPDVEVTPPSGAEAEFEGHLWDMDKEELLALINAPRFDEWRKGLSDRQKEVLQTVYNRKKLGENKEVTAEDLAAKYLGEEKTVRESSAVQRLVALSRKLNERVWKHVVNETADVLRHYIFGREFTDNATQPTSQKLHSVLTSPEHERAFEAWADLDDLMNADSVADFDSLMQSLADYSEQNGIMLKS